VNITKAHEHLKLVEGHIRDVLAAFEARTGLVIDFVTVNREPLDLGATTGRVIGVTIDSRLPAHLRAPGAEDEPRPYLFYYDDTEGCFAPLPVLCENLLPNDAYEDGDHMTVEVKCRTMTPSEYENLPER